MIALFYIIVSVCLIVFQTIVRPSIPMLGGVYDLLIPLIIYFSLFRPVREALPAVALLGFFMDTLSGAPAGVFLSAYLWQFLGIQWMVRYLRVGNTLLLPLVVAVCVLVENLICLGTIVLSTPGMRFPHGTLGLISVQLLWALVTGAVLLWLMEFGRLQWKKWAVAVAGKMGGADED